MDSNFAVHVSANSTVSELLALEITACRGTHLALFLIGLGTVCL